MKKPNKFSKFLYYGTLVIIAIFGFLFMARIFYIAVTTKQFDYIYSTKKGEWVHMYQELGWETVDKQFKLAEIGDLPLPVGLSYNSELNTVELFLDRPASDKEKQKITNYFKTLLSIRKRDIWVNLDKYDTRIASATLAQTAVGCDMLAADYLMKLLSAYYQTLPDFCKEVTVMANKLHGRSDFDPGYWVRVWINSADTVLVTGGDRVYIKKANLKAQCEVKKGERYKQPDSMADAFEDTYDFLLAKFIAPKVEYQIRNNLSFATLRQLHRCMILADWLRVEHPVYSQLASVSINADTHAAVCYDISYIYREFCDNHVFKRDRISYNKYGQRRIETQFRGGVTWYGKGMLPKIERLEDIKDNAKVGMVAGVVAKDSVQIDLSDPVTEDDGDHLWKRYSDGKRKQKLSTVFTEMEIKQIVSEEEPEEKGGLEF